MSPSPMTPRVKYTVRRDDQHRYWTPTHDGEIQRPGYSELCAAMGVNRPNPFYTAQGREEGIALHLWLGFLVRGKTPASPPDLRIAGRVEGIKKFLRDSKFIISGGEEPLYDPTTGTCCTPDLWGFQGAWSWVKDAKRGGKLKSHALQTAAQKSALAANGFRAQKRSGLYLRDNGYRDIEHTAGVTDDANWRAIVAGYHVMTPEQRAVFAAEGYDPKFRVLTDDKRKWRIILNAHAARSYYL